MTAFLFAMILESPSDAAAWTVAAAAFMILVLDGVDGWIARTSGAVSRFGARFDMETDAAFILAVSILTWQYGKTGPWILMAGLMRYAFVAGTMLLPWMRRSLPSSQRRKRIFVAQAVSLILSLVPLVVRPFSDIAAITGLLLLACSFTIDVAWLFHNRPGIGDVAKNDNLTVGYGRE
jgi:phosphatidylglycerophosphate synthase